MFVWPLSSLSLLAGSYFQSADKFGNISLKVKEVLYVRDQPLSSHMKDSSGKFFTKLMESASKTSEGFTAGFCYLTYLKVNILQRLMFYNTKDQNIV